MNATATDMKEAWDRAKEFLEAPNETVLFLKFDSEYSKDGYTIVKLPYGENIDLIYAMRLHGECLHPNTGLKYAGFYHRQHKQSYCIREPLNRFFEFNGKHIYEGELKTKVIEAIQRAVANKIADMADSYSELDISGLDAEIIRDAETAFSKKETMILFSKKIEIKEYWISESAMVDLIDNPDNIENPKSQLKRHVDDRVNGHEEELARLWYAHLTSQKLLDRLYAESEGCETDEN